VALRADLSDAVARLRADGVDVAAFVDPETKQIDASLEAGFSCIELNTGAYAIASMPAIVERRLAEIAAAARHASALGLHVSAGSGLDFANSRAIASVREIEELSIGHAILARALFEGIEFSVKRVKKLMTEAVAP
jgi:pyridoxine 5-phosphate synthase